MTQRLSEADLLASRDETRETRHVRITAQGARQKALHLALATLGGGDAPTLDDVNAADE